MQTLTLLLRLAVPWYGVRRHAASAYMRKSTVIFSAGLAGLD